MCYTWDKWLIRFPCVTRGKFCCFKSKYVRPQSVCRLQLQLGPSCRTLKILVVKRSHALLLSFFPQMRSQLFFLISSAISNPLQEGGRFVLRGNPIPNFGVRKVGIDYIVSASVGWLASLTHASRLRLLRELQPLWSWGPCRTEILGNTGTHFKMKQFLKNTGTYSATFSVVILHWQGHNVSIKSSV